MKKTLLKTVSIFSLIFCILVGSSFNVYAYEDYVRVSLTRIETTYGYLIDHQRYYVPSGFTESTNIDDFEAYIYDNHAAGGGASSEYNNLDPNYPIYIVASTTNVTTETGLNRALYCYSIDDLSNYTHNDSTGSNTIIQFMSLLVNNVAPNGLSAVSTAYGTLFDLGYRFYHKTTTTWSGSTYYLYALGRFKSPDHIDFSGTITESGTISGSVYDKTLSMFFKRYDFEVFNMRGLNDNKTYKYENGYISLDATFQITGYSIYEMHDVSIIDRGYYGSLTLAITGTDPYIVLCQTVEDATSWSPTYNSYTINGSYYMSSTDLSGIANTLTEIKDLLSDMQVQEIQNIYNNIEQNYNVDIDLELNNYLDDFSDGFNSLDFDDQNVNIPTEDIEKIGTFRIIFSNMINTLNSNGLGIVYFLPFVLLIIGAIL